MATLEVKDLRKVYDTPAGKEVAVDGVSFKIEHSEFVTLVGPSGCGKTTTLRCIAGLETPTSGKILLNGRDITELPPNKRDLSMMFQSIALYPHMTVRENISYPLKVDSVSKSARKEPTEEAAKMMQITDMLDKMPGDLSGGQQQRAALARTVVQEPSAFLMDEPLSDLDAKLKVETRKVIQRLHRKFDRPMIYVTHDQEEAMTMSDSIAVLNRGKIEQFASPDEIFHRPANTFVGQFIGQHGMNLIDAELVESKDGLSLSVNGYEPDLHIDMPDGKASPGPVKFGFRPENTAIEQDGTDGIPGMIRLLESFGEVTVATIETEQYGELQAVVNSRRQLTEDTEVIIRVQRNAHIFDSDTGSVLDHPEEEKANPPSSVSD